MAEEEKQKYPPCPYCTSPKTRKLGFIIKSNPFKKTQRYQCTECGKTFQEQEEECNEPNQA